MHFQSDAWKRTTFREPLITHSKPASTRILVLQNRNWAPSVPTKSTNSVQTTQRKCILAHLNTIINIQIQVWTSTHKIPRFENDGETDNVTLTRPRTTKFLCWLKAIQSNCKNINSANAGRIHAWVYTNSWPNTKPICTTRIPHRTCSLLVHLHCSGNDFHERASKQPGYHGGKKGANLMQGTGSRRARSGRSEVLVGVVAARQAAELEVLQELSVVLVRVPAAVGFDGAGPCGLELVALLLGLVHMRAELGVALVGILHGAPDPVLRELHQKSHRWRNAPQSRNLEPETWI